MILVKLTTPTPTIHYLSLDGHALEHFWRPEIISFSPPSYETATPHGGYVKVGFGSISFSPDVFAAEWPPPDQCDVEIYYTATTEAAAVSIFAGIVYLSDFDEESVSYEIYNPGYSVNLLETGTDYNGDEVPLPRAFGAVTHVQPVRLPDDGATRPTFHLGGIGTTANAVSIESFTTNSAGAKTKVVVSAAHGWSNDASITINGSTNFNGTHTIESASGTEFVIPVAFPTDNSEKLPIRASAFVAGGFRVYDDGVPIDSNVLVNGDGTFSLTAAMVGTITISGTGPQTTLTEIMEWAQGELGITSYDDSAARATSPNVGYWADKQMPLTDFCSDLCAFFSHFFHKAGDTLYIGDMLLDNGTSTLAEHQYFTASYSAADAVKQLTASWTTWEEANGVTDDGTKDYKYIKAIENEAVVTGDYEWGQEQTIEPFHDVRADIEAALDNILTILNKRQATVSIPINGTFPAPGEKITFADSVPVVATVTSIWARSLRFDFDNDEIQISGEGVIS